MIAVIADDLTGAAEIAGIGLNYQLKTEVNLVIDLHTEAELLIVAANTRGLPEAEARAISQELTIELMKLQPQFIFKKIDSVLRGNIIKELEGQMAASGHKRALIVPGNLHHQKTVLNGIYYYQGKPVNKSAYAKDPEHPATSPKVRHMLGAGEHVQLLKRDERLPEKGLCVGDLTEEKDYKHWISQIDAETTLVGAAGLFEALLENKFPQKGTSPVGGIAIASPKLFVFGSTFHQGKARPEAGFNKMTWHFLPPAIAASALKASVDCASFIEELERGLKAGKNCVIAINPIHFAGLVIDPKILATNVATLITQVLEKVSVPELLIEGGATAQAIINKLGITSMYPKQHLAPGVIRLKVPGNSQFYLTLKPGSYEWPALALE